MIKCYFVDVKSISSTVSKSKFKKAEIDRLADAIIAADGLLRPLILQQTGVEKYTVIEGHREYYAAIRAKEKDIKKAEMVNAFIINADLRKSAIDQLNLLIPQPANESPAPDINSNILTDLIAASIDRLLPEITAAIAIQLQPIVSQLTEHQQVLNTIKIALVNKPKDESEKSPKTEATTQPVAKVDSIVPEIKIVIEPTPKIDRQKKIEPVETLKSDLSDKPAKVTKSTPKGTKKTKGVDSSSSIAVAIEPKIPAGTTISSTEITKIVAKQSADSGSIDSDKSATALNLINTLSQSDLTLRMERSGVLKAIVKSVPIVISKRDSQPSQKFETWEDLINAKITGLTASKIPDIIKKLK
jgi:ParB-like nuclease domain